jgi:hypothetical protein
MAGPMGGLTNQAEDLTGTVKSPKRRRNSPRGHRIRPGQAVTLAGLTLRDPDGADVPIEDLLDRGGRSPRWLVIQALRYYG